MTQFSEIGFIYQRDGKKDFSQQSISLRQLTNMHVTVLDFAREKDMIPFETTIKADGGYGYMFT